MHNAAEFANPSPLTTPRTSERDLHLWSPEISGLVAEKRRLRRVWFLSRNPRDKTALNRATKDLKDKLSTLRQDSFKRFLKIWNLETRSTTCGTSRGTLQDHPRSWHQCEKRTAPGVGLRQKKLKHLLTTCILPSPLSTDAQLKSKLTPSGL